MPLDADRIAELLVIKDSKSRPRGIKAAQGSDQPPVRRQRKFDRIQTQYPSFHEDSPVRLFDKEFRCVSKGCHSPTYYKLRGIPYCGVHLIYLLTYENEKLTKEKSADGVSSSSSESNTEQRISGEVDFAEKFASSTSTI